MRPVIVFDRLMLVFLFSTLLIFTQDQQSKMLAQDQTLALVPSETPFPSTFPTETAAETPTASPSETPLPTVTTTPLSGETPTASETPTEQSEITLTASPTSELSDTPTLPELTLTVSPSEAASEIPTEGASPTPGATATASLTDTFTETATASATQPVLEAEPPLALLFTDTFDTGSLALWNLGSGWSLTNHDDGQALQADNSDEPVTFIYNTLNNAVIATRFILNTGMLRLSLRQSDAGAYTAILSINGQLALYRGEQVIATAAVPHIVPGTWHILRLSAINTILRVSLDGQEVITSSDSIPLPPGTFSIAGINNTQTLLVDDVSLWIPTSDLPSTATPTSTDTPTIMAAPEPLSLSVQSLAAIPGNTQILFTAQRDGNDNEIYSLDPTNCVVGVDCPATQITFDIVEETYPTLSADGSKIAFVSNRTGNDELYVMDTTGNNLTRLTYNSDSISNPKWSPDGSKIAFVSQRDGTWKIYVLTRADCVSGTDCPVTLLTTATTGGSTPAWSPDGTKIAYSARVNNRTNLWVMNADGTNNQQLTDTTSTGITNTYPAWSPDGNWIAFQTTRYGSNTGNEIAKLDYAGCAAPPSCPVTRLTTNPDSDEQPSWSPDGNLIAYSAQYGSTQRHLTIMNADGTNSTRLTYSGINNLYSNWSVLNSAYPPDNDRLFTDNFEQNDFKNWSTSQTDFGDLSVSASAAIMGNYGLLANLDDNASIYLTDGFAITKRLRMHFFFDPNSISMANGDAHYIVAGNTYTYQIEFRRFNNEYQIRATSGSDSIGVVSYTNWYTITDAPHSIEFAWTAATAPGTNDGSLSLWIDNALQQTITGIDNDTRSTSLVYIGAVSGVDTNTRGTYYFDEVEVRKLSGSGGFIPTVTPTPTPTITPTPSLTLTPTFTPSPTPSPTPAYCPAGFKSNSDGAKTLNDPGDPCVQTTPTPIPNCQEFQVTAISSSDFSAYQSINQGDKTNELTDMGVIVPAGLSILENPMINSKLALFDFSLLTPTPATPGPGPTATPLPHLPAQVPWGNSLRVLHRIEYPQTGTSSQVWYQFEALGTLGWVVARYNGLNYFSDTTSCANEIGSLDPLTFNYDRRAAANYAIEHSWDYNSNPQSLPSNHVTRKITGIPFADFYYSYISGSLGSTGSAVFVSEAIWAGGLPMTVGDPNSCGTTHPINQGWRYCRNVLGSSDPWDYHQELLSYYTHAQVPGPNYPNNVLTTTGTQLTFAGCGTVQTDRISSGNPYVDSNGVPLPIDPNEQDLAPFIIDRLGQVTNTSGLATFLATVLGCNDQHLEQGDYIYINPQDPTKLHPGQEEAIYEAHGLLVVGWGPIITDCTTAFTPNTKPSINDFTVSRDSTHTVPYVVDFTTAQPTLARPFYCTMAYDDKATGTYFFRHDWFFFHMPESVTLQTAQVYVDPDWSW